MAKSKKKSKAKAKNNDLSETLRKNAFWIAVGLIAVSSSIVWLMATMSLASVTKANLGKIKAIDGQIGSISPDNPNETFIAQKEKETAERIKDNHANWRKVYDQQQQVLTWPESFTASFLTAVNRLPLPERLAKQDKLGPDFRRQYQIFAKNQVDDLCKIIDAPNLLGRKKGDREDEAQSDFLVDWDQKSQKTVRNVLTFSVGSVPSTRQVLYAQEDYWVYSALAKIVADTNKKAGSEGSYNAAVKRIEELGTGVEFVPPESNNIHLVRGTDEDLDPERNRNKPNDDDDIEIPKKLLTAGKRYVDARGNALKGNALLALEDEKVTEFKRMPVYMRLRIDQRYLGSLMAECNNSPLTVEVRKVMYKSGQKETKKNEAGARKTASSYYELTVEIYGTVYIFYPPPKEPSGDGDEAAEAA